MSADSGVDELADALPRLFTDEPWESRRIWLDETATLLLSDAADGRLAVMWQGFSHDRRFQLAIEQIKLALDEARERGRDDQDQSLSKYLASVYLPPGPLAVHFEPLPMPPEVLQLGPSELLVFASLALLRARSWETRRRILVAYPSLLDSGDFEHVLQAAGSSMPGSESSLQVLLDALLEARERGFEAALRNRPEKVLFTTIHNRQKSIMTDNEALQFALLAFLGAPSWSRRRLLLYEHRDVLLSEQADVVLDFLAKRYPPETSTIGDAIPAVRDFLQGARLTGIDAAFDGALLPPTRVRLAPWDVQTALKSSDAEQTSHFREFVHFIDPDLAPWTWARVNIALVKLLATTREEVLQSIYLEEALWRVQDALEVISVADEPDEWREAQQLLGRILVHRFRGDRATNLENAILALKAAMEALPPKGHIEEAITLLILIGQAYLQLPSGVRADNLETAAAYLEQAIIEPVRQQAPTDWALAKITLGQVCEERIYGDRRDNFENAIHHLKDALSVADLREQDPRVWATAHLTLASLHARRRVGEPRVELDAALKHAELAMTVFTREEDPRLWAATRSTCAAALFRRAANDDAARANAQEHWLAALEVFDATLYPNDRRHVLKELGGVAFYERRWQAALELFEETKSLNEFLEGEFARTDAGRLAEISEMGPVYERLAWCYLQLGDHEQALQVLEAGKTRQLRRTLAVDNFAELDEHQLGTWNQLLELVPPSGGLVSFVITTQGAVAYVLGPDGPQLSNDSVVVLDDDTDRILREILDGSGKRIGWLRAYADWLHARNALVAASEPTPELVNHIKQAYKVWADVITWGCGRLWDVLLEPVYQRLLGLGVSEGGTVVVLPSRLIFGLPLAAAWRDTPSGRRYLIDDFSITIGPSATAVKASRARSSITVTTAPSLAMVIDPTGDLPWTVRERAALKKQFPDTDPIDPATVKRVIEAAANHTHLHLACHGAFDWIDPMGSGLMLSDDLLTARAIATAHLPHTRLVSLSACETGLIDIERFEYEYIGLAGAFHYAGAAGILSSLWTVEDESTAMLMSEFYALHIRDHVKPADALRYAQLAVRKHDKFKEPFYWAAFQLVGT